MSDATERLNDAEVEEAARAGQIAGEMPWFMVQALAQEALDFRRLAALCAEHGGIERVVAMGLAVAAEAEGPWANYIRTVDGRMVIAATLPATAMIGEG